MLAVLKRFKHGSLYSKMNHEIKISFTLSGDFKMRRFFVKLNGNRKNNFAAIILTVKALLIPTRKFL
jgi:hypothetical protein